VILLTYFPDDEPFSVALSNDFPCVLSLHRFFIVGLSEKGPREEVLFVFVLRKKYFLSSVFCKIRAIFGKIFPLNSKDINRLCKMLATTRFQDTPLAELPPRLTFRDRFR
jgi:hypothetical protein